MAYLMLDPVGRYPNEILRFLARFDRGAVAVFSSRARYLLWRDKWSRELSDLVLDEYLAPHPSRLGALAARIGERWPRLEGVIAWDEESVLLGADLGERLGLGWNPRHVIERCRDKAMLKAWLREKGTVRVNDAEVVEGGPSALAFQRRVGRWPVVVKPTRSSGSADVYFPGSEAELLRDCQRVLLSGSGGVLLEEYLGGAELCVNGIVDQKGDLLVTDVWHYDRRPSHGIPNLYYQSTKVSTHEPVFGEVGRYAAAVVETLELKRCPIHLEVKVDDRGPCLIEIGPRLSGGNLPVLASRCHGRSLLELAACHYLADLPATGRDLDYGRYDRSHARVLSGIQSKEIRRIRKVHGVAEVESMPSFAGFGLLRQVGQRAPITRDLDTEAWEVYLFHTEADQVALDAERVRALLRYE